MLRANRRLPRGRATVGGHEPACRDFGNQPRKGIATHGAVRLRPAAISQRCVCSVLLGVAARTLPQFRNQMRGSSGWAF